MKEYILLDVENPTTYYLAGTTARVEDALASLGLTRTPIDYFEELSPEELQEKVGNPDKALGKILSERGDDLLKLANALFRDKKNAPAKLTKTDIPNIDVAVVKEAVFDFFYKDIKIMLPYLSLSKTLSSAQALKV